MIDFIVALALLFGYLSPPDYPSKGVRVAFNLLADRLEVNTIGSGYEYEYWFPNHVAEARNYLADLQDAPLVADADRLPPWEIANKWVQSSALARDILKARASIDPGRREAIELVLDDDLPRHNALTSLAKATRLDESIPERRAALKAVRCHIGAKRYAAGQWPAPIPFHLLPNVPQQ